MSDNREILQYFRYEHLPEGPLRITSMNFAEFAQAVEDNLPGGLQKTLSLYALLIAKDAAVRAALNIPKDDAPFDVDDGPVNIVGFVELDETDPAIVTEVTR